MRPIDADILVPLIQEDRIEGKILDIVKALGDGLQAETLNQACDRHIKIIRDLPTIDAVPVVRCKDCKHKGGFGCPWWKGEDIPNDWYCANGERKEE